MYVALQTQPKAIRCLAAAFLVLALLISNSRPAFAADTPGRVYVQTNQPGGNAIAVFERAADGGLALSQTVATDGLGTGAGLGSQASVVLSGDGRWLFAVNAGSHDISSFRVTQDGLSLVERVNSGGLRPISLAIYKNLVYVLNAGDSGNISGFTITPAGSLSPVAGSTRPLSNLGVGAAPGPAQVSFSPDGRNLVVSEKATNRLDLYAVSGDGLATGPAVYASSGATPFGFAFTQQSTLVVSEAFGGAPLASAVSSYQIDGGQLQLLSGSVATGQTAACWIAVSKNGKFAYSTNAGSGSVSAYRVSPAGSLSLIDGAAGLTGAGTSPIDAAVSNNGQYLYVLNGRTHNLLAFAIAADGTLQNLGTIEGLPAGSAGIAAW